MKFLKKILKFIKKRWWIILLIAVIGFIIYTQTLGKKSGTEEISYKVKRQTLKESLSFSGDVDADEKAILRFQTSGRLDWVGVEEGDAVKKGQLIALLDQRSLKKTLQKELNDYSKERLDFDQNKDDTREVVIGALNADRRQSLLRTAEQAQYDLTNSVLDVELQTISIELANLYSPVDGIVTKVGTKHAGVNVTPTQAEFEIVNPETIYFSAGADQTDVVKLKEGETGEILFDSFPDEQASATITSISFTPKEGEVDTVYEVKMALDDFPDVSRLRLAMTGDVSFTVKEKQDAVAVPTTFIKTENNKHYVWKKDSSGKKVKTHITTGEEIDIATEVLSGLKPGDIVYD